MVCILLAISVRWSFCTGRAASCELGHILAAGVIIPSSLSRAAVFSPSANFQCELIKCTGGSKLCVFLDHFLIAFFIMITYNVIKINTFILYV